MAQTESNDLFEFSRNNLKAQKQLDSLYDVYKNSSDWSRDSKRPTLLSNINQFITSYPNDIHGYSIKKEVIIKGTYYLDKDLNRKSNELKELYGQVTSQISSHGSYDFYLFRARLIYDEMYWFKINDKDLINKSLDDWEYIFSKSTDERKNKNEILANTYYSLEQYKKAVVYYSNMINGNIYSRQSSLAYDLSSRARCYTQIDSLDLAIKDYDKAIEIVQENPYDKYIGLGTDFHCGLKGSRFELLIDKSEWDAVEPLLADLDCAGKNVNYWKLAYAIYALDGDLNKAVGYIDEKLNFDEKFGRDKMSQENYDFYTLKAYISFRLDDYQETLKSLDFAEKLTLNISRKTHLTIFSEPMLNFICRIT